MSTLTAGEILIRGRAGDSVGSGEGCDGLTGLGAAAQLVGLGFGQGEFATLVKSFRFCDGNSFALPFEEDASLKLRERAHQRECKYRHRRIVAGEGHMLLEEFDAHTAPGQILNGAPQVVKVSREPVHAVDNERVAVADVGQRLAERWPVGVLAAETVGKDAVKDEAVELAVRVLLDGRNANVTNALCVRHFHTPAWGITHSTPRPLVAAIKSLALFVRSKEYVPSAEHAFENSAMSVRLAYSGIWPAMSLSRRLLLTTLPSVVISSVFSMVTDGYVLFHASSSVVTVSGFVVDG